MTQTIPLRNTQAFSKIFLDYISGDSKLSSFYGAVPKIENFEAQMKSKSFAEEKRKLLFDSLDEQYKGFKISEEVWANVNSLLKTTTYTVTTGHQLNIFGGPLYFIYKIITTINTAKVLNEKYPNAHFVPVFWMATEDHDFEEINHFNFFAKSWKWETQQKGAVGRFTLDGMEALLKALPEKSALFEKAYSEHKSLSAATRYFVNELFGADGLVIIDADNSVLKKQFSGIVKDELLNKSSYVKVQKTSAQLEELGYEAQVHAREINLFYLENNLRERIIPNGNNYKVNNTDLVFSEKEILEKIETEPEKFSPNVILRPIYQECILPNLAYIGGPGELAYWLQLKEVFDYHKISFPILMPRSFALYINKGNFTKISKLSLEVQDFFQKEDQLKNSYLTKIAGAEFKLGEEQEKTKELFLGIKNKASLIDKTMEATVLAELQKAIKILEELEKRLKKAEERKNETAITQLLTVKEKLFPGGGLQERSDNFLSFYLNDTNFINKVKQSFDPFNYEFYVISEHE
ncbi:MAG TPA: bacillithiol biosynthesis cysteine-adding enzyme BshC [Cytophagaceae bacterium]|jgi:bacillithiol biosynthesis cysteine-adding enzyme BshC|nr:bacillithiol biosynthesis cysteine-adding enzyme BshC [Cytophagaceae bacterium]